MKTYISILRGINVSGQKLIKMDVLRKMVENLGFEKVKTYVQSGNVVFKAEETSFKEMEEKISAQIEKDFGFQVPVIVLDAEKLKQIIESNPFLKDTEKEVNFMHVTFLSNKPNEFDKKSIEDKKQEKEEIRFTDHAVYLYCPNGYGKTKITNNFIETKLKVLATTRNWKTTNELLRIALE